MDLTKRTWCYLRGIPANGFDNYKDDFFIGDTGRLLVYDGVKDNVTLAGSTGDDLEFSLLTSFQIMQEPSVFKRVSFIRARGNVSGATSISVQPVYDFYLDPMLPTPDAISGSSGDTWDVGLWDTAVWSGVQSGAQVTRGGRNMGVHVAVAMRGVAAQSLNFVGWDVMWNTGGLI